MCIRDRRRSAGCSGGCSEGSAWGQRGATRGKAQLGHREGNVCARDVVATANTLVVFLVFIILFTIPTLSRTSRETTCKRSGGGEWAQRGVQRGAQSRARSETNSRRSAGAARAHLIE